MAVLGGPLAFQGAHEEAVDNAQRALRMSPIDALVEGHAFTAMAMAHFGAGHYADCVVCAQKTIERHPEYQRNYHWLIAAAMQGDTETTAEALAFHLRVRPEFSVAWLRENTPYGGEIFERLLVGLRKAGIPEG